MKRVFDFSVSLILLVILALPLVAVAVLVLIRLGRPVFFVQMRSGIEGRAFPLFKFRTMTDARSEDGRLMPDGDRLTPFGCWLRSSSVDELPGLWNVLRGDMSLIGPRPLPTEYVPRYSARQSRRLNVRPGITGWAQVNGRNALSWPEKLELDVWYVENRNFWLDLRILLMTVGIVLRREGISAAGEATMSTFMGNEAVTEAEVKVPRARS